MKGTEPNRFRLRDDMASRSAGRSSTQAGPRFEPIVPSVNSTAVVLSTNRRAAIEGTP